MATFRPTPRSGDADHPVVSASEVRPTDAAASPHTPPKAKRTEFALKAFSLALEFQQACSRLRLVGPKATFRVEMAAPEGPSTGGGKQAVQHVKLVPDLGPTIVMGQVNGVQKTFEIRDYEYLSDLHHHRFKGQPLPFDRSSYESISDPVIQFFTDRRMRPITSTATPAAVPAVTIPLWKAVGRRGIAALAIVIVVLAAAVIQLVR
jgi:hypothetical protein